MPRAMGAQPVVGGQVDPSTTDAVKRTQMFRQQRAIVERQEQGATNRAQIAASAQRSSANTAASSRIAGAQIGKEAQAMQTEADDRRAAEKITARVKDREFGLQMQRENEESQKRVMLAEDEIAKAKEGRDEKRVDKARQDLKELRMNQTIQRGKQMSAQLGPMLKIIENAQQTETQRAKSETAIFELNKRWDQEKGTLGLLRKNIQTSLVSNSDFDSYNFLYDFNKKHAGGAFRGKEKKLLPELSSSFSEDANVKMEEIITKEINRLNIPEVTGGMLKMDNYSALENLVEKGKGQGGIGKGELQSLMTFLEETKGFLEKKIMAAKEGSSSALLYRSYLGRAEEASRTLNRLGSSKKKSVSTLYDGVRDTVLLGINPAAAIQRGIQKTGGLNIGELADYMIGIYQKDPNDPDYLGFFGDAFGLEDSLMLKTFKGVKKDSLKNDVVPDSRPNDPNTPAFVGEI